MIRNPSGESAEKTERNAEMVRLYTEEHMTLEAIGGRFGVTRERVRQIVKRAGVGRDVTMANHAMRTEENLVDVVCEECGKVVRRRPSRAGRFCSIRCSKVGYAYGIDFLLNELRALALSLNRTPGNRDLRRPWPTHGVYYRVFGSMQQAQVLAGLATNVQGVRRSALPDGFREEWAHLTESVA